MDTSLRQAFPDRAEASTARADRLAPTAGGELMDNRPAAALQRSLADLADRSPRQVAQAALRGAIERSPRMAAQRAVNRTGLPDALKNGIENLSGMAMDDVRVHYNSAAPAQLQALAYARGSEIHLGPGQEQHLPHEAWHVVQQRQGRVAATQQAKGVGINDDPGLEHEADVMGARALQGGPLAQLRGDGGALHGGPCDCPGCHGGPAFQLKYGFEGAGVVQRVVTVTIADANGVQRSGTSGNEATTRNWIERWPAFATEFKRVAQPHAMPVIDDAGRATADTYVRGPYMCAEPHALALLLHHYERVGHGLAPGYIGGLTFPAIAIDSATGGDIAPCPVCAQWVNGGVVPMVVQNLNAVAMKNQAEFDQEAEDRFQLAEAARHAQEEEKEKSAKKAVKSAAEQVKEQKAATGWALQAKCNAAVLFPFIKSYLPGKMTLAKNAEDIKELGDTWLEQWIDSLAATDARVIALYAEFDAGHKKEFATWLSENAKSK